MLKGLLKTTTKPKPVVSGPGGVPAPLPSPPSGGATAGAGSAASAPSSMMSGGSLGLSGSGSGSLSGVGGVGGGVGSMPYASSHGIEPTPRADVALPHHNAAASHKRERRRSSVVREERAAIVRELPALKDCPPAKREALFKQKLALCSVIFEWDPAEAAAAAAAAAGGVPPPVPSGSEADIRAKEIKRLTLLELVEHVNSPGGQKLFTDAACEDVIAMVSANIFRTLPAPQLPPGGEEVTGSGGGGGEDGEEEPTMEPSWPHLQLVYELLLRFIVSPEVKAKTAKKWIDGNFCTRFIEMFDSEDPRERDYLKTILHRIYGKFMSHRSLIRKAISHVFYRFVYETEKHAGIGELLEILGSIINGFALPLKPEHVTFLERALIPLHHPRSIASYFQQLCYCVTQYVEKDPATVQTVVKGLVRSWPLSSSSKQIILLNELEEVLEIAGPDNILPVARPLFLTLAKCVGSTHFQVAERALFLWNNEGLVASGILSKAYANEVLPLLYTALTKNASGHWNTTVETLAQNVLKHYHDANPALYERCAADSAAEPQQKQAELDERRSRWAKLEAIAADNASRGGAPSTYSLPLSQVTAPQRNALVTAGLGAAIGANNASGNKGAVGAARPVALSASTAQVLAMAGSR